MPSRGPQIRGCGCITRPGECCPHQRARDKERKARFDARRPSARQRGYTKAWEHARAEFLNTHPTCQRTGCNQPSAVVDHITPHKGNRSLFWNCQNWQALCAHHHASWKQSQERHT